MPRDDFGLERLIAMITPEAMAALRAERDRQYRTEAMRVPYGKIVSELLIQHLPQSNGTAVKRKRSRAAA